MNEQCQEMEGLLAGYALETIPVEARLQVEVHVGTCPSCRAILEDYQAVAGGLLGAAPPRHPPARLRARVLAAITPTTRKPGWLERWRSMFPRAAVITGLVAICVLALINIHMLRQTNRLIQVNQVLIQQNQASQTSYALLTYPDSQVVLIEQEQIYGTLIYDPDGQVAVLNVWGLGELPDNQDYQVWLIKPDQNRASGGVFHVSSDAPYVSYVIESPSTLDSFTAIGVTVEPAGGSPGPTGPKVFGAEF